MRCPWCVYVAIGSQCCPLRCMRPEVVNLLPVAVYVAIGGQSCPWRADALPVVRKMYYQNLKRIAKIKTMFVFYN